MLLKATFPSSYFGLVEATSAVLKEGLAIRLQRLMIKLIGMSSTYQILKFAYIFIHAVGWPAPLYSPPNAATAPTRNRLRRLSVWKPPPNCRRFRDNLYQAQLSGCSALPESRRQSLPHPYSPLRAPVFLRISRNRVQASNPHLNKSFEMKVTVKFPKDSNGPPAMES